MFNRNTSGANSMDGAIIASYSVVAIGILIAVYTFYGSQGVDLASFELASVFPKPFICSVVL
jgi:hypothetical protein